MPKNYSARVRTRKIGQPWKSKYHTTSRFAKSGYKLSRPMYNNLGLQPYSFKVRTSLAAGDGGSIPNPILLNNGNNWNVGYGFHFTISAINNVSEFKTLFDSYKINAVKITFFPSTNMSYSANTGNAVGIPRMITAVDYNDSSTPASEDVVREYNCSRRRYLNKEQVVYIKNPRVQMELYKTAISTGYAESKPVYIDLATNDTVPHYGLQTWFNAESNGSTAEIKLDYEVKYYFTCRRSR